MTNSEEEDEDLPVLTVGCLVTCREIASVQRGRGGGIDQKPPAASSWAILGARRPDQTKHKETKMTKLDTMKPVQILPGVVLRMNAREGTEAYAQPDGAGGVTIRVDWRHAMEFWFELHLDPRGDMDQEKTKPLPSQLRVGKVDKVSV
jgi:hypothetical protein